MIGSRMMIQTLPVESVGQSESISQAHSNGGKSTMFFLAFTLFLGPGLVFVAMMLYVACLVTGHSVVSEVVPLAQPLTIKRIHKTTVRRYVFAAK